MAEDALAKGNRECAKAWFHEAAGCFHVGQHFFFIDAAQQERALKKIWSI